MYSTQFTSDEVDLEGYRTRLRKMTDEELIREGKAERFWPELHGDCGTSLSRSTQHICES